LTGGWQPPPGTGAGDAGTITGGHMGTPHGETAAMENVPQEPARGPRRLDSEGETSRLRLVRYHPRAAIGDGGMSSAIRGWSVALAAAGAEVTVAFEDGDPPFSPGQVNWARVEHRGVHGARIPVGLDRLLLETDLLVLHGGWNTHNLRAATVARTTGVPYLLEPRGAYDPSILRRKRISKRIWWWAGERRLVAGAAAMHAFFPDQVAHVRAVGYRGPVVVAPNGVEAPASAGWTRGRGSYLLWLGRFDPEHKGLDLLVRAIAGLAPVERPNLQLVGPEFRGGRAQVIALVHNLGLEQWVKVGPPVYGEAKRTLLLGADGFVYPSRWEACGNSVLEAVALGLPTLCTTYPLGRQLADRGAVIMAEPTIEALGAAIGAMRDHNRMDAVGRAGATVARTDFAWSRVASSWLSQVATCLGLSPDGRFADPAHAGVPTPPDPTTCESPDA
jgi:glycosyltransferase involved in cell wall biosynthesis